MVYFVSQCSDCGKCTGVLSIVSQMGMPLANGIKTADDAGNNTTSESHVPRTIANDTCTTKRNNLAESTGVVPAKHPLKVKLELFSLL